MSPPPSPNGPMPRYAELLERPGRQQGTAWGIWGPTDQLGTINHLTPERVLAARDSIVTGDIVPLNLHLAPDVGTITGQVIQ